MKFKVGDKVRFLGVEACKNSKYVSALTVCMDWMGLVEGEEYIVTDPDTGYDTPPIQTYIKIDKCGVKYTTTTCHHLPEDVFELVVTPEEEFNEHDVHKALRYNTGKPKWSLVCFAALIPLVQVLMFGASKYAPHNWKKPMNGEEILESMQRHLAALFDGETHDSESKLHHIGHIMCNAMFYSYHYVINKTHAGDIRETELN